MIVAAAIRFDGQTKALPAPAHHKDIVRYLTEAGFALPSNPEIGFIDDALGFVDNRQAGSIAKYENQVSRLKNPPELSSEELW